MFLAALVLSFFTSVSHAAPVRCEGLFQGITTEDSARSGLVMHGEHWVDLILLQAGTQDARPLKAFEETLNQLVRGIEVGRLPSVNEKIDGSPSVVFGFTAEGKPFVAYKGHLTKKTQALVTTPEEAAIHFAGSVELRDLFTKLITLARDSLFQNRAAFQTLVFQGDVVYSQLKNTDSGIEIQANSVNYLISPEHALFGSIKRSQLGIVFHSVGERVVAAGGRIEIMALAHEAERPAVEAFTQAITTESLLALHPWRENVATLAITAAKRQQLRRFVETRLSIVRGGLEKLTPEFRGEWNSEFEAKWRTFLNAGLRPPHDGGFYQQASSGRALKPDEIRAWIQQFGIWLRVRGEDSLADRYAQFVQEHAAELTGLLNAYAAGIAIQSQLQYALAPAFVSKLGGGEVEGVMLKTEDSVVKWVDRLGFTLKNNVRWEREGRAAAYAVPSFTAHRFDLPFPYEVWRPGASFVLMKAQPIHAGHIAMIREAAAGAKEIFVVASDKEPDLAAQTVKEFGAAAKNTKKELAAREYTYIFDQEFRRRLLREGLPDGTVVTIISTSYLRSYLSAAKTAGLPGKIKLVVGDKEVAEGRYDRDLANFAGQLELQPITMQADGISATQVRAALKIAATGKKAEREKAVETLNQAFRYIESDTLRKRIINQAVRRWAEVDQAAQALISGR